MPTQHATHHAERTLDLSGWPVRVTSYKLGATYHATVDNVSPGAAITRADGSSQSTAEDAAIRKAEERLAHTRRH